MAVNVIIIENRKVQERGGKFLLKHSFNCVYYFLPSYCYKIVHVSFYKQLHYLLQLGVAYSRMNCQPKSCLARSAHSIQLQPLIA